MLNPSTDQQRLALRLRRVVWMSVSMAFAAALALVLVRAWLDPNYQQGGFIQLTVGLLVWVVGGGMLVRRPRAFAALLVFIMVLVGQTLVTAFGQWGMVGWAIWPLRAIVYGYLWVLLGPQPGQPWRAVHGWLRGALVVCVLGIMAMSWQATWNAPAPYDQHEALLMLRHVGVMLTVAMGVGLWFSGVSQGQAWVVTRARVALAILWGFGLNMSIIGLLGPRLDNLSASVPMHSQRFLTMVVLGGLLVIFTGYRAKRHLPHAAAGLLSALALFATAINGHVTSVFYPPLALLVAVAIPMRNLRQAWLASAGAALYLAVLWWAAPVRPLPPAWAELNLGVTAVLWGLGLYWRLSLVHSQASQAKAPSASTNAGHDPDHGPDHDRGLADDEADLLTRGDWARLAAWGALALGVVGTLGWLLVSPDLAASQALLQAGVTQRQMWVGQLAVVAAVVTVLMLRSSRLALARQVRLQAQAEQSQYALSILGQADTAYALINAQGTAVWVNQSAYRVFNAPLDRLVGLNLFQSSVWQTQGWTAQAQAVLDGQDHKPFVFDGGGTFGQALHVKVYFTRVMHQGQPHVLTEMQDRTAEWAHSQRLNTALKVAKLGFWRVENGQSWWDEVCWAVCGYPGRSAGAPVSHEQMLAMVHPEDRNLLLKADTPLRPAQDPLSGLVPGDQQAVTDHVFRVIWPDDSVHWLHLTRIHEIDQQGRMAKAWGFIQDITEQRAYEETLVQARQAAEAANRAKSEFLSVMSHELRTPLNGIMGSVQILQMSNLPGQAQGMLGMCMRSSQHLLSIINDVLDYASIEAGRIKVSPAAFDLHEVVREVESSVRVLATQKQLELHVANAVPATHQLLGDAKHVKQVLLNLLGNAVKFTPSGRVSLQLTALGEQDGALRIEFVVSDTGIGIDAQQVPKLFKPFSQVDSSMSRPFEGTGLGLSISQNLVHLMGGHIEVKSVPGVGSRFVFSLSLPKAEPLGAEQQASAQGHQAKAALPGAKPGLPPSSPVTASSQRLQGVKMLLIDDNESNLQILARHVQMEGAQAQLALSVNEARALIENQGLPDVVLMDLQMTPIDGLAGTRILRTEHGYSGAVIAVSANVAERDRQSALSAGMNDFVPKPVDHEVLVEVVRKQLQA